MNRFDVKDILGYALLQRKALKNIIGDSQGFMLGILWAFIVLFAFGGINGEFLPITWLFALYTIYKLFKTAMNAAEVGL